MTGQVGAPSRPDPLAEAGRLIALVVASNQPLYPLYLHWIVGGGALAACGTLLSTPLFLAAALMARRQGLWARVLLPLAGLANTVWSEKLLGAGSGVGLFVIPCGLIALLILRWREWPPLVALAGLCGAAVWLLPLAGAEPIARLDAGGLANLFRLNAYSVATLTAFAGWTLGRARFGESGLRHFRGDRGVAP